MTNIHLPKLIVTYCRGLLCTPFNPSMSMLGLVLQMSHDAVRRILIKKYHWKEILASLICGIDLSTGYLIIDETEVKKTYSKVTTGLSWVFSHKECRHIYGYQIVLICWTNGDITIPLAWKIYQKGVKTKIDLAIELMQYCLFVLQIQPLAFLFDAYYSSEKVLSYLRKYNQDYFTQVPKNRLLDGKALKQHEKGRPYWKKTGYIKGKIHVQVVRNRKKYFITNRIGITRKEQLDTYRIRWKIELIFRFVKSQLGLERCQSTSKQVQQNHFGCCFLTYALLQDIAQKTGLTEYRIKLIATVESVYVEKTALLTYMSSA